MSLASIDWIIIVAFLLLSLGIGLAFRNRASKSLTDFFLGGRSLPWYIAGISMVATTFAADTPLAVTEMVADKGISKNWIWWSFLAGGLLTTFFFSRLWRRANILTEPEFIEFRYSGKVARFLRGFKAVYLGLFLNCLIIGWVNLALSSLLTEFFGIPEGQTLIWIGLCMLVAVIYASLSGLLGVAVTDTVQFFLAMIGVIVLAVLVLNSVDIGGVETLKAELDPAYFEFFPSMTSDAPPLPDGPPSVENSGGGGIGTLALSLGAFLSFVAIQWWASWYPGAEPGGGGYIAQRMMSAKNERHSLYATLFFNIGHYCLRPWPWIIVALCAVYLYTPERALEEYPALNAQVRFLHTGLQDDKYEQEYLEEVYHFLPHMREAVAANPAYADTLKGGISDTATLFRFYPTLGELNQQNPTIGRSYTFLYKPRVGYLYAMKDYLPSGWLGLLLVAFLAAYLSTISTQVNWGASYLINDLYKRYMRPEEDFVSVEVAQKHYVKASRWASILIMICGLAVVPMMTSISGVWEFLMECGAGLGLVLILRWYWWRINAWSELVATIAPFIGYVIGKFMLEPQMGQGFIENKGTFIFTVGFTTVAWLVATFVTRPTDKKHLVAFHERVRPDGWWKPVAKDSREKGPRTAGWLLLCWIGSVVMVYAILFAIGKAIFGWWQDALIWTAIGAAGCLILLVFLRKTNLFK